MPNLNPKPHALLVKLTESAAPESILEDLAEIFKERIKTNPLPSEVAAAAILTRAVAKIRIGLARSPLG